MSAIVKLVYRYRNDVASKLPTVKHCLQILFAFFNGISSAESKADAQNTGATLHNSHI